MSDKASEAKELGEEDCTTRPMSKALVTPGNGNTGAF